MLKLPIEFELEEAEFKYKSIFSSRENHCYQLGAIRIYVNTNGFLTCCRHGYVQDKTQQEIKDLIQSIKEER